MLRDLAAAVVTAQAEAGLSVRDPLFLEVPDENASADYSTWLQEVLALAAERELVSGESDRGALARLIGEAVSRERGEGASGSALYVLDSTLRSIIYDVFFWELTGEDGPEALDAGLRDLIGTAPDPELGVLTEWIAAERATVRERFHAYTVDMPEGVEESPLLWVGGFATALEAPGGRTVGAAAFTATGDVGAVIASLNSIAEYLSGSDLDKPIIFDDRIIAT